MTPKERIVYESLKQTHSYAQTGRDLNIKRQTVRTIAERLKMKGMAMPKILSGVEQMNRRER